MSTKPRKKVEYEENWCCPAFREAEMKQAFQFTEDLVLLIAPEGVMPIAFCPFCGQRESTFKWLVPKRARRVGKI
jgi:hypothetical protein